jgi:hemerythrin-like metal-binding protein
MDDGPKMVRWHKSLLLGDQALDAQHRELITLAARVYRDCPRSEKGVLLQDVRRLTEHAAAHFLYEESWMSRTLYPELQAHTRHHRDIIVSLERFSERLSGGKLRARSRAADFLQAWSALDIATHDRAFAEHLQRHAQA